MEKNTPHGTRQNVHYAIKSNMQKKKSFRKYLKDGDRGPGFMKILCQEMECLHPTFYTATAPGMVVMELKDLMEDGFNKLLNVRSKNSIARSKRAVDVPEKPKKPKKKKKKQSEPPEPEPVYVDTRDYAIVVHGFKRHQKRGRPSKASKIPGDLCNTMVNVHKFQEDGGILRKEPLTYEEEFTVYSRYKKPKHPEPLPDNVDHTVRYDVVTADNPNQVVTFDSSKEIDNEMRVFQTNEEVRDSVHRSKVMIEGRNNSRILRRKYIGAAEQAPIASQLVVALKKDDIENAEKIEHVSPVHVDVVSPKEVAQNAPTSAIVTDGGLAHKTIPITNTGIKLAETTINNNQKGVIDEIAELLNCDDYPEIKEILGDDQDSVDQVMGDNVTDHVPPEMPNMQAYLNAEEKIQIPSYKGKSDVFFDGQKATCNKRGTVAEEPDIEMAEADNDGEEGEIPQKKMPKIQISNLNIIDGKKNTGQPGFYTGPPPTGTTFVDPISSQLRDGDGLMFAYATTHLRSRMNPHPDVGPEEDVIRLVVAVKLNPTEYADWCIEPDPNLKERHCINKSSCIGLMINVETSQRFVPKEYVTPHKLFEFYQNQMNHSDVQPGKCILCLHAEAVRNVLTSIGSYGSLPKDQITANITHKVGAPNGFSISQCIMPGAQYHGAPGPLVMFNVNMYRPKTIVTQNNVPLKSYVPTYPISKKDHRVYFLNGVGELLRELPSQCYVRAIEDGIRLQRPVCAEEICGFEEGGVFCANYRELSQEMLTQLQVCSVKNKLTLQDCKGMDLIVKKQAIVGQAGKTVRRTSSKKSRTTTSKDGNALLSALTHGKVAEIANREPRTDEPKGSKSAMDWVKSDVCHSIVSEDPDVVASTEQLFEKFSGTNPPWLPPAPAENITYYDPDTLIVGDPNRYITPIYSRQILVGFKDVCGTITEEAFIDATYKDVWVSSLPPSVRTDFIRDAECYLGKLRIIISKERSVFASMDEIDEGIDEVELNKIVEELGILNILREGQYELVDIIAKAKDETQPFELTNIPYPLLEDIGMVYKKMRGRYEYNMKCRRCITIGREHMVITGLEAVKKLNWDVEVLTILKNNAVNQNSPMVTKLTNNIEQLHAEIATLNESIDKIDDTINEVMKACKNPYLYEIRNDVKISMSRMIWHNSEEEGKAKNAQSNVQQWVGWKGGFLDGVKSLITRKEKDKTNWSTKPGSSKDDDNPKRIFTKVNALCSERLDPLFDPFVIRPVQPFIFNRSIGRWEQEMPHERVFRYLNELILNNTQNMDELQQRLHVKQLLPNYIKHDFMDSLITELPQGPNYRYAWYPKKMSGEDEMAAHTYYCTTVARVNHIDDLLASNDIPTYIKKDLVLMQDMHLALICFMCDTGKFSDAELNEPVNSCDLQFQKECLERLAELRNERRASDHRHLEIIRFIDIYMPNYAWVFHQGELPNLSVIIGELGYHGGKNTKSETSYDVAYEKLIALFDKTLELPMRGRNMHNPMSKFCMAHDTVYTCILRIFHCALGGYYTHANVIMNFPVRFSLYRMFCFRKMDKGQFCSWLYSHTTFDHVIEKHREENHNHFTNTVMKEYVHFMITSMSGLSQTLDAMHYMPEIRYNIQMGMDGNRQTLNDVFHGTGIPDFRFHKRYMYYFGMRFKNGKDQSGVRKTGLSASVVRISRHEVVGGSAMRKDGKLKTTLECDNWQLASTDPEMFYEGGFPQTGEDQLVEQQYTNLWNKIGKYGKTRLCRGKNLDVLARLNVGPAKELCDRIKALKGHEALMSKKKQRTQLEYDEERAGFKYDFRKHYKLLHASASIGSYEEDNTKCACPECADVVTQDAYEAYQKAFVSGELSALIFSYPGMDVIENMDYWIVHEPNHAFQWRKKGILLSQYICAFCPIIDNENEGNPAFHEAKKRVTDDEYSMMGNMAVSLGDAAELTFDWMVLKPILLSPFSIDMLRSAVNQYMGDSYTIDVLKVFSDIAKINPRAYHLLKYYFIIACKNRVVRSYTLPLDSVLKVSRALHHKAKNMGIGPNLPSCLTNIRFCEIHGSVKRELTDFSSKAIYSIGDLNTTVDLATGLLYCKKPDPKEPGVLSKFCTKRPKNNNSKDLEVFNGEVGNVDAVMDMTEFMQEAQNADSSVNFFCSAVDNTDMDQEKGPKDQQSSVVFDAEAYKSVSEDAPPETEIAGKSDVRKWAKFRVELNRQIDERCSKTPLREENILYKMLVLYDKAIRLCEVCGSSCIVTNDKYTEFGFCCGVCIRKIRLNMPYNMAAYLKFRCAACNPKINYNSYEVSRYLLFDDTSVFIRRFRFVHFCAKHDKSFIGEYPCLMNISSVMAYVFGDLIGRRNKKGEFILIEDKFKSTKFEQRLLFKSDRSAYTETDADRSHIYEHNRKEKSVHVVMSQIKIPEEWYS